MDHWHPGVGEQHEGAFRVTLHPRTALHPDGGGEVPQSGSCAKLGTEH